MSAKRPSMDLLKITSSLAVPMTEAVQRQAMPTPIVAAEPSAPAAEPIAPSADPSPQLRSPPKAPVAKVSKPREYANMGFKIEPEFKFRFRKRAVHAGLKLNELLKEALTAWEQKQGLSK